MCIISDMSLEAFTHRQECRARTIVQGAALREMPTIITEFRSLEEMPPSETLSSYARRQLNEMPTDPDRVAALVFASAEEPFAAVELYRQACTRRLNELSTNKKNLMPKEDEEIAHLREELEDIGSIFTRDIDEA